LTQIDRIGKSVGCKQSLVSFQKSKMTVDGDLPLLRSLLNEIAEKYDKITYDLRLFIGQIRVRLSQVAPNNKIPLPTEDRFTSLHGDLFSLKGLLGIHHRRQPDEKLGESKATGKFLWNPLRKEPLYATEAWKLIDQAVDQKLPVSQLATIPIPLCYRDDALSHFQTEAGYYEQVYQEKNKISAPDFDSEMETSPSPSSDSDGKGGKRKRVTNAESPPSDLEDLSSPA
jgi:hypothetical protein